MQINLLRLKDNLLHLNNLRKFVSYEIFGEAIKSEFKLQILDKPHQGKVLVLSPHSDDDVIGCGGTIKLHIQQNDQIKIIYLTNGSKIRKQEAKKATEVLGVDDIVFWKFQDGKLSANNTIVKLMQNLISDYQPKIIYVPSFLDPHPDHLKTAKILVKSLKNHKFDGQIYSYEVWSPIYANRLVNIDKVIKFKKQALETHQSQLQSRSYLKAITGLNQYRAGMYGVGDYAEAFFACNKKLYLKLFGLINLEKE